MVYDLYIVPLCILQQTHNKHAIEQSCEMSRHPSVKWAQSSDKLFITIELPDAKDVKLKLEPEGKFFFSAKSGTDNLPYEIDMDLFDKVDVNESKANVGLRNICYLIKKAESKWWNRLLKQEGKPPVFLKVDWDKWVDEDEEQDSKREFSAFPFPKLILTWVAVAEILMVMLLTIMKRVMIVMWKMTMWKKYLAKRTWKKLHRLLVTPRQKLNAFCQMCCGLLPRSSFTLQ
ncbi:hypothetical protein ACSBR1_030196 [Camellia fascicularis]